MVTIGKKLINEVDRCVDDALEGFTLLNPGLRLHHNYRFVSKGQEEATTNVAILSGGGSGHEPFCTGYVGRGMLAGAVAGSVFASPPKTHILHAIRHLSHFYKGGVLVIIPNYTGDCLNFGMAIEQAKSEDLLVDSFVFGDDCASAENSITGRRGMCGLICAYKIAGGLSASGKSLKYIMSALSHVQRNISTLGVSLQACSLPGQPPLFKVADDEVELGTGVHGEAGIAKLKMMSAKGVVRIIVEKLVKSLDLSTPGEPLVVLVNNLGATSQLEQNIICKEVHTQLCGAGFKIKRMYAGMLMTSLDMSGFQISLVRLASEVEEEWLDLLDRDTDAPSWAGSISSKPLQESTTENVTHQSVSRHKGNSSLSLSIEDRHLLKKCLQAASQTIKENEMKLNKLDGGCGDGDCGSTLKHLAEGILQVLPTIDLEYPADVLQSLSEIAEAKMGGTSGAIYSLAFTSMSQYFMNVSTDRLPMIWAQAMKIGVQTVMKYGRANQGDRTIVDALLPAAETLFDGISSNSFDVTTALKASVKAAQDGCDSTKSMTARAGRASYVNKDRLTDVDAGARGFVLWLEAIAACFK